MSRRAVNKTDRRTRYTKKIIQESYLELLDELPIEKVTVTDICRRADINRGTFYLHYENLPCVMDDLENDVYNEIITFIHGSLSDEENRQNLSDDFFVKWFKNQNLQKVLFESYYTERLNEKILVYAEALLADLCVESGQLNKTEAEMFASFMIHACYKAAKRMRESPENEVKERSAFVNRLVKALYAVAVDPHKINDAYNKRNI